MHRASTDSQLAVWRSRFDSQGWQPLTSAVRLSFGVAPFDYTSVRGEMLTSWVRGSSTGPPYSDAPANVGITELLLAIFESYSRRGMDSFLPGVLLPAAYGDIAVLGIEFDGASLATCALGCD